MPMKLHIAPAAREAIARLEQAGYSAYIVGGCVRDSLMGQTPSDWDVTTDATPEQVRAALDGVRIIETGIKHGTVTALLAGGAVEITTFRVDGAYEDHRHPSSVSFTDRLENDLARRDFTMNAVAYNERTGLVDPFGGSEDIRAGVIRAVGNAAARFDEDALRILRALRFSAVLGFAIEGETASAVHEKRLLLNNISSERIRNEFSKLICGKNAEQVLLGYSDVIAVFLPEIEPSIGFDQKNYHHIYDVWEHTVRALGHVEPNLVLRLVMLLHDLGKPQSHTEDADGVRHFYGHPMISTGMAGGALLRLRYDTVLIRQVCTLVEYHDSHLFPTENSVRRWLMRLGEENLRLLIKIKRADNLAQSPEWRGRQHELAEVERVLDKVITEKQAFSREQLLIDGRDLIALGAVGEEIGRLMSVIVDAVITGRCRNERSALLAFSQRVLDSWNI